jgi:hypothetical protein
MSKGSDMLLDAARTLAERGRVYGDAAANMATTARLWSVVLGFDVTGAQVALCLVQLKVARLLVTPDHSDSAIDIAGYAAVLCETQKDV